MTLIGADVAAMGDALVAALKELQNIGQSEVQSDITGALAVSDVPAICYLRSGQFRTNARRTLALLTRSNMQNVSHGGGPDQLTGNDKAFDLV